MAFYEYAVEAYNEERWGNSWRMKTKPKRTYEEAVAALNTLRQGLEANPNERFNTGVDTFRIVRRLVGTWEPVEE